MKKISLILLALTALIMVGCDTAMERLNFVNGTKFVVKSKKVPINNYGYLYRLVKAKDTWYGYAYNDTADFNVGDTIIITVKRLGN